jgi:hypothetical protein
MMTYTLLVLYEQARLRDAEAAAELARTTAAQEAKSAAEITSKLEADLQVRTCDEQLFNYLVHAS